MFIVCSDNRSFFQLRSSKATENCQINTIEPKITAIPFPKNVSATVQREALVLYFGCQAGLALRYSLTKFANYSLGIILI
ncbi:hypothetical protein EBR57_07240 [bacterium]|nr:hypothetical protein [bacterium]